MIPKFVIRLLTSNRDLRYQVWYAKDLKTADRMVETLGSTYKVKAKAFPVGMSLLATLSESENEVNWTEA